EGEWIELKNIGVDRVNLFGWKLDDIEGGSLPYKINHDLWIESGGFYLAERSETGLALNNSNESVRLFNNSDELIDEVDYEKSFSGESYARAENKKWFWTTVVTPGEENIISVADSQGSKLVAEVAGIKISSGGDGGYILTTLEKIRESEIGDLVKTKGIVAVEPGIFGTQYFYIVGSSGVQIYNYKKDFPFLKIGDYIEVQGEISEINGEKRIKTKQKEDIVKVESRTAPLPENITADKITEEYLGCLVSITGEITDRKASDVYLDDSTDEARIYIKKNTGIDLKSFIEGERMEITGIVSQTSSGLKIMPRSSDDIIGRGGDNSDSDNGQVLGEVAQSSEWNLSGRNKKQEFLKYLLILAGGVILILAGLLVKELKKK
ncbi:MAG: lamin tail domain-containing protein, partial [Patescibacteria group bacterium]